MLVQVTGEGDDKHQIAAAEQPLCALHWNNWIDPKTLPVKYKSIITKQDTHILNQFTMLELRLSCHGCIYLLSFMVQFLFSFLSCSK